MNRGAASHASAHASGQSDDAAAVALRGASLAFHKKPALASPSSYALSLSPSPPPSPRSRARHDGALTAALRVGNDVARYPSPSRPAADTRSPDCANSSSSSSRSTPDMTSPTLHTGLVASRLRQLHPASAKPDPKNPSFIAATLAASRSVSPKPKSSAQRRKSTRDLSVDAGPIAPTGALISLFDKPTSPAPGSPPNDSRLAQRLAVHRFMAAPPRSMPTPPSPVVRQRQPAAPAPRRPSSPPSAQPSRVSPPARTKLSFTEGPPATGTEPRPRPEPRGSISKAPLPADHPPTTRSWRPRPAKPPVQHVAMRPHTPPPVVRSTPKVLSPKPLRLVTPTLAPSPRANAQSQALGRSSSPSPDPQKRLLGSKQLPPFKPRISQNPLASQPTSRAAPCRGSASPVGRPRFSAGMRAAASEASSSSPSPPKSSSPSLRSERRPSRGGVPPSPPLDLTRRHHANASTSTLQLDSLASAIMAGSLASARLTPQSTGASRSSRVSLPPPSGHVNRQKSPRMLQTLRQPPASVEEESDHPKKGRRHKLRKGKHAHHEGARKRWREEMTARERKRYEAVWASNRGCLIDQDGAASDSRSRDASECVANVVVRELWRRSRLPEDELAEAWDLVDRGKQGMLTRPEFVVGMWLIDQRLRGRKLPHKVSDSLWGSANGLTVMKPKIRHI